MTTLAISAPTTFERGRIRGRLTGATVRRNWPTHLALFALAGHSPDEVRRLALESLEAADAWWPGCADELRGVAEGAGVELWQAGALQARTELLVASRAGRECTIVGRASPPMLAQVWDWHRELRFGWHTQVVSGGRFAFAGLTEHGITAKIGRNEAGVGLVLAILSHADDVPGLVPVHTLCHRILAETGSLAEAREVIASAPLASSSALGVVATDGAAIIEVSPTGVADAPAEGGWLLHANHFRAPELASSSRTFRGDPDSYERQQMLTERAAALADALPTSPEDLVPMLRSVPGEDIGNICCVPRPEQELGVAWQTLATVAMSPEHLSIRPGSPVENAAPTLVS